MKKINLFKTISLLMLSVLLASCSEVTSLLDNNGSGTDNMYTELSSLASHAKDIDKSDLLDKKITFSALVISKPEMMEFDEEDGGSQKYVYAIIARNISSPFLINVSNVETNIEPNTIFTVTGTPVGIVYSVIDNKTVNILDIKAEKMEIKEAPDSQVSTGNITLTDTAYHDLTGTFEFKNGVLTTGSLNSSTALVYFDFTNNGKREWAPPVSRLLFYQNEHLLKTSIFSVNATLDPSALDGVAGPEATYPGKTNLYYIKLVSDTETAPVTADAPIYARYFDDDFNLAGESEIKLTVDSTE